MERVEAIKCECRLRPIERCREPAGAQELCDDLIHPTVAEIDRDTMYSGCVKDAEIHRNGGRKGTGGTTVPELDAKANGLKGIRSEKKTVPDL
jgi:hypothetical protein